MATGATLVEDALLEASILGLGEVVSAEDQTLGLRILNRMLDSWANENLMIYSTANDTFSMTPAQNSYSTSLLASGRPVSIASIYVTNSNIDYEIDLIDEQTYDAIPFKQVSAIPNVCFYDAGMPNGTLNFYPAPSGSFTCTVHSRVPLAGTITAATTVTLPPGYEKAIIDNLAVELCRPFTRKAALPDLAQAAMVAKKVLKRNNYEPLLMSCVTDNDYSVSNDFPYRGF
jgi:hypothetical protein